MRSKKRSEILTCSIGIASTELLAKIAAEMNKPDDLILLPDNELPARIEYVRLTKIPGISSGIEARLCAVVIGSFSDLWNLGPKRMRSIWGNVEGERFWNGLHGQDCERPPTVKCIFGHSRMLSADWSTPDGIHECAKQFTLSARDFYGLADPSIPVSRFRRGSPGPGTPPTPAQR